MKHVLLLAFVLFQTATHGQSRAGSAPPVSHAPTWTNPPKLVVGIVVDQMRVDYIYRFWDNFTEGGFKRMVREGAFMRNTHYDYVPTHTAPGHASVRRTFPALSLLPRRGVPRGGRGCEARHPGGPGADSARRPAAGAG